MARRIMLEETLEPPPFLLPGPALILSLPPSGGAGSPFWVFLLAKGRCCLRFRPVALCRAKCGYVTVDDDEGEIKELLGASWGKGWCWSIPCEGGGGTNRLCPA